MQTGTNGSLDLTDKTTTPRARPYYERLHLGVGHDNLLRCDDCRKLVTYAAVRRNEGLTTCCGTRKLREVRQLRFFEWLSIRLGLIDFEYRKEFLAEFGRVKGGDHA